MTLLSAVLITFAVLLAFIAAMAIGVMNGRKPISGSCGGLSGGRCEICNGGPCQRETER